MRFVLGFLLGYYIRGNKPVLAATLTVIAVFFYNSARNRSFTARERLSRPPQTRPFPCQPRLQDSRNHTSQFKTKHPCLGPSLRFSG